MDNLFYKVSAYLGREPSEQEVLLMNEGSGAFISVWNVPEVQPTDAQLNALESEANALKALAIVNENRAVAYAQIGEQLDMQYWDQVNGTTTWKDHVASVKAQYPKV
jgi:hypothetical protein